MAPSTRRVGLAVLVGVIAIGGVVVAAHGERGGPGARGEGSWDSSLTRSPFERSEVGAARIGDRIYVVGGFFASGQTTRRMAAYDISADAWRRLRSLPKPVNHPGVAALDGRLYVLGGNSGGADSHSRAAFWRYAPDRNRWTRLPNAPTPRAAMGFAARGDRLYAAGGQTEGNSAVRRLEIYDVSARRWRHGPPMPTGRNHLTAVFAQGTFWAIGGRTAGTNLAAVERYDPYTRTWRAGPPLNVPRGGIAAAVAARSIVVLGGEDLSPGGTTIAEVERLPFADADGPWQLIEPMPTPRHGLGGAARGAFVYALEGGTEPRLSVSNVVERLDLSAVTAR